MPGQRSLSLNRWWRDPRQPMAAGQSATLFAGMQERHMQELETQIRRATAADAEALSRLSAAVFPLGCPADTRPEDLAAFINRELTPERFAALLEDERNAILVVRIADQLAGYALVAWDGSGRPEPSYPLVELRRFYLDAVWHGRGVANALMQAALAIAEDEGDGAAWLSVFSGNPRAIRFYERWGFRITGTHHFLVGTDYQQDYLMQRQAGISTKENS
jgi:diamine N-acetyltransferase